MAAVGGERRSAYSWRASRRALHTLGEGEVVQSTRLGYRWRTIFHTGFSTTISKINPPYYRKTQTYSMNIFLYSILLTNFYSHMRKFRTFPENLIHVTISHRK
jgi:hypothetical protein